MSAIKEIAFAKIFGGGGSGGAVNVISGTFTPAEADKGTAITVNVPYTGNGYPVMLMIYPKAGAYNSDSELYSVIQKKVVLTYMAVKCDTSAVPDYSANEAKNKGYVIVTYKGSDTSATTYAASSVNTGHRLYLDTVGTGGSQATIVAIKSNSAISVYVATTDQYGIYAGTEYSYAVVYSG